VRILVTGAFGNIGAATLHELLEAGHAVRGFDLDTKRNREVARTFDGRVEPCWGDVARPESVAKAVEGCDAVIHDAALLWPGSERDPALTHAVNVDGTRNVIAACEAQPMPPRLVFASSCSLFGPSAGNEPPTRADDPVVTSDAYTRSKAAGEELLRASTLDWVILRFAATPPVETSSDHLDLEQFFATDPDTRIEYLHRLDAGLAQTRAIDCAEASRKVLLIGGGPSCQTTMGAFNAGFLEAAGIGAFPREAYGDGSFYTDWMDTEESQRLLGYQRHDLSQLRREIDERMRRVRPLVRLLRTPLRWWLLRHSAAHKRR
jgi:nucleoside-diphosphate-sugar epimerase